MKNKRIFIIFSIIILSIIIGILFFIFLSSKDLEQNINIVNSLLNENNYEEAYIIINNKKLLKKANNEIAELIENNIYTYKISDINSLLSLNNEDWKNIESLNNLVLKLNLDSTNATYQYLNDLLKIKENYEQYFNSIRWINSSDYKQYQTYNDADNFNENTLTIISNLLSQYSFEKYDLTSTYIKELHEETQKLSNSYNNMATALEKRDNTLLETNKVTAQEAIMNIGSIQIEIIIKSSEIEKAIQNLPMI